MTAQAPVGAPVPVGEERARVAYLGGLGRSGTTLLARLLGELQGVCSIGEVCHLWERGLGAGERCGCGVPFPDCPFWAEVGERAFGGWASVDLEEMRRLRAAVQRTRYIPRLATRVPYAAHHLVTEYVRLYERLYEAVRTVSHCQVVVDSSKEGSLAYCLRWSRGLDVRVLHCVRDSPGVAHSWQRTVQRPEAVAGDDYMPVYSPVRSAALWNLDNAVFELLARLGTPAMRVRYEDLVCDPAGTLAAAAGFLGLDPPPAELTAGGVVRLRPTHSVSGNPMRFATGAVPLVLDDAWRRDRRRGARRLVAALTVPFRLRYGYPSRRPSR